MRSIGVLIGFDARMPGVLSFVSPVFKTPEFDRAGQVSKSDGGVVDSFRVVAASPGFMAASVALCVVSGQARVYAFQTTDREIVVGEACRLAGFLEVSKKSATAFLNTHQRTSAAIDRFVAMASTLPKPTSPTSIYVMRRRRITGRFSLAEVLADEHPQALRSSVEAEVKSLRQLVWRGLRDQHNNSFGGHTAFGSMVRAHVLAGGIVSQEAAAIVASSVVAEYGRRIDQQVIKPEREPCKWCAFSLVGDYPSDDGVRSLLRLAATELQLAERSLSSPDSEMLEAIASVLSEHFRNSPKRDIGDSTRDEFVFVLNRMASLQLSAPLAVDVIQRLGRDPHEERWIVRGTEEAYIAAMQDLNEQFDSIATTVEAVGAEEHGDGADEL